MTVTAEQVIQVASRYLGPEAKRFLERQAGHLENGATLENLRPEDVEKLAWWVNVSAKLIMDKEKAKELSIKISSIGADTNSAQRAQ